MLAMVAPGLRETKRLKTERRLAAIAYALVNERGFAHVTVDDIVAEAHVSRRTFSNYYACKEEAVAAVILHDAADGLAGWRPDGTAEAGLIDLMRGLLRHQFAAGVLARLAEVARLGTGHRQLVPYLREAQWRLWAMAGDHVLGHGVATDPARQAELDAELDAVLGAVFGVVSAHLSRVYGARRPDDPRANDAGANDAGADDAGANDAAARLHPERIRQLVDHVLDRLETGLGPSRTP